MSGVNFWPFLANEGSLEEGQVMDPAEEVLLDPVLVNPFFTCVERKLFLCQLHCLHHLAASPRVLAR